MAAPDPFESAKLLIERAGEHVDDFKRKCDEFFKRKPYAQFVDTQSKPGKELYKLRLTEEIPVRWSTIVADAISNLRHALDHAIGASARAAGATRLKAVYFPFCGDAGELESTIRSIAGTNKHQMLTGILTAADSINIHAMTLFGSRDGLFIPGWDSSKNELTYAETPVGTELQYDLDVAFSVAFGDVEIVGGERVVPVLQKLGTKVLRIVSQIEAACRRGGYIT